MNCLPTPTSTHHALLYRTHRLSVAFLVICLLVLMANHAIPRVFAAAQPAAQDPYPAPPIPEIAPIEGRPPVEDAVQPYPAPTADGLRIVGDEMQQEPQNAVVPGIGYDSAANMAAAPQSSAGLYFLWGGFLAALLIFATAVVGSVVLFARRVQS